MRPKPWYYLISEHYFLIITLYPPLKTHSFMTNPPNILLANINYIYGIDLRAEFLFFFFFKETSIRLFCKDLGCTFPSHQMPLTEKDAGFFVCLFVFKFFFFLSEAMCSRILQNKEDTSDSGEI